VAFGGRLVGDTVAEGFTRHDYLEREYEPVHALRARSGSLAAALLANAERVNSAHHQAVAEVPAPFTVTAWAPDGVIEAIEAPGLLGVQWHPERLCRRDPRFLGPFSWLIS
jgi:putative glutamine amidotransferase